MPILAMNVPVRFFLFDPDAVDVLECTERDFLEAVHSGERVTYERHTVRENGVSQICLTAGLGEG